MRFCTCGHVEGTLWVPEIRRTSRDLLATFAATELAVADKWAN
jgi:hypothetical protein